tara:strand:+ start:2799 stop:3614 length:816 start_codon:yes stop_codon:yes gene_type:complete
MNLVKKDTGLTLFSSSRINPSALEKVNKFLPELDEKTNYFNRQNSQTTLSLMTLTMLGGQSPYRLLRQILAEVQTRKHSLLAAQTDHVKGVEKYKKLTLRLKKNPDDPVLKNDVAHCEMGLAALEDGVNALLKDIATLIDRYNQIKEKNNIVDWDEKSFEDEEKRHHVKRAFELMYRNVLDGGRPNTATIEYCQQFGIHPQVCFTEACGYVEVAGTLITQGELLHANHLEDFLDEMGEKYKDNVDATCERIFGVKNIANYDYMYKKHKNKH